MTLSHDILIYKSLTEASLLFMVNPPLVICCGGETSGVTGLNKRVRCDLTSSATDMVWVMEEPYFGTDGAVGLKSITYSIHTVCLKKKTCYLLQVMEASSI